MTKVLIIEEEALVARMYQKALIADGFEAITAISGNEGLEKVKTLKPDIVLCDIMMPPPNGIEVLDKIRSDAETREIPVIMLTNLSGEHDMELALAKGAKEFWVKKDVSLKQLGKKINTILGIEEKA